jgi:hypothetical protein
VSVKSCIHDGLGSGRTANVTPQNALLVQVLPETSKGVPPADLSNLRFLTEFFRDSTNSIEQRVLGTLAAPVDFTVSASAGVTKWITDFRIILEGQQLEMATQDFRQYGAAAFLTNGLQIQAIQSGTLTEIAPEPIRLAGDYFQYADGFTNLINTISSTADYLQFNFVLKTPVVLTEGSSDQLRIRIRDNMPIALQPAGLARQYAVARGYQEFV